MSMQILATIFRRVPTSGRRFAAFWLGRLFALFFTAAQCQAEQKPQLYFYPPPYRFSDGHTANSPQTIDPAQITKDMPKFGRMDGVVLLVYWSSLCPEENKCDFSLIDTVLQYWRMRGKKVVLDVAPIGFPVRTPDGVLYATPDWVMRKIKTYKMPVRLLGATPHRLFEADLPDFRDPVFVASVKQLIVMLKKYDGNPTIAEIRIGVGVMGEDNAFIGAPRALVDGFTEDAWFDYDKEITDIYKANFNKTELEFDIARLSWRWSTGTSRQKMAVDGFVDGLLQSHIFLAFDGLSSRSYSELSEANPNDGVARSLHYLTLFHKNGGRTGLEAMELLSGKDMADDRAIVMTVKAINPDRLVFFADVAAKATTDNSRASSLLHEIYSQ